MSNLSQLQKARQEIAENEGMQYWSNSARENLHNWRKSVFPSRVEIVRECPGWRGECAILGKEKCTLCNGRGYLHSCGTKLPKTN